MRTFEIIDVHQHLEVGVGLRGAVGFGPADAAPDEDREYATRIQVMDAMGMAGAVILAGNMYLRPNGLADTRAVNDAVAAYRDRAPDRFVGGVGVVEPLYGAAGFDEVRRCGEELGLAGVSFHNGMQGVPVDSPLMRSLVQKIGEAGMIPFIHALGNDLENIWQVDSLAKDFPDLPMVILDVFHNIGQVKALPEIAERRPNLLFDLVFTLNFELMGLPQVRAVGAERFLYGSNFYSWPTMKKPFGILLEEILASDLDDTAKAAILGGNARRLLGPSSNQVLSRPVAVSLSVEH